MGSPWREPAEETTGLYPHLVVHDGRVSGSITFGPTRLPVWAPYWAVDELEDYAQPGDPLEDWRTAANGLVHALLNQRGEFARLMLVIANAERLEDQRRDRVLDDATGGEGGLVNVTPGDPGAVQLPPSWWEDPDLYGPVVDQLQRCLTALGG